MVIPYVLCLLQVNNAVVSMVDLYFPPSSGVCIIAEPGSFFVSSAFTLAVNVISKEMVAHDPLDQAHGKLPSTALTSKIHTLH